MDTITIVAICVLAALSSFAVLTPEAPLKKPTSKNAVAVIRVGIAFFMGFVVYAFWGVTMVDIFGLPEIDYWQAMALVVLRSYLLPSGPAVDYRHQLQEYALRKANEK